MSPGNICYAVPHHAVAGVHTWHSALSYLMASANVPVTLNGLTEGSWAVAGDARPNGANGTITILRNGFYKIGFTLSADSDKLATIHAGLYVNGALNDQISNGVNFGTALKLHDIALSGIVYLYAGDVCSIRCYSDVAATTFVV